MPLDPHTLDHVYADLNANLGGSVSSDDEDAAAGQAMLDEVLARLKAMGAAWPESRRQRLLEPAQ